MKAPSFALDKKTLLDWLLRYGDKLALALLILTALRLAWGGIEAFRAGGTTNTERPDAIAALAEKARVHIDREKKPPAGELPKREPLGPLIGAWREPTLNADSGAVSFREPLFPDFSRRTKPDVLPIEDLRAAAGIHVVATKAAGASRKPDEEADAGAAAGKLTPYVVVTGLVPVSKQEAEFKRRFSAVGFQDPTRDAPVWGAYQIERAEVGPKGVGEWKVVMTGKPGVDPRKDRDWEAAADEGLAEFALGPAAGTPVYCGPIPRLVEGAWAADALHPRLAAARQGTAADYKLLRFFDADVQPTVSYAYRVKHVVVNPNYNDPARPEAAIPPQDLEDPELAKAAVLFSPLSNESRPVTVPVPTRILVETLRKVERSEIRNWKPGWVEIMILGPGKRGRARALRSLVTEPGGMANVDEKLADAKNPKPENRRSKGEDIVTDQILLDVRGQQEDKAGIQEPFEILMRRPDGGFERVTAVDSESLVDRYRDTLPKDDEKPAEAKDGASDQPVKKFDDDPFKKKK